ncbi:Conserved hypothetical membrane protein [Candidatus Protochlamydia naegleriophila]|uniref:Conserved hypothetical membrane protein n=2 Tax=Candidatus Protochlamydia naegleriophila TaxID=389348 RepID=A0A0U5JCA5_9BACT|nr:Conserved hypothetical membrane protein [Candidatus Protochlamydia naegleriophila]
MYKPFSHLVFYDGECGLCDRVVQLLLKLDKHGRFVFAPLKGETAAFYLKNLPDKYKGKDSLILIEDYQSSHPQTYVLAKGALRICWLLGGIWSLVGCLSFLPSVFFDWAYRLVAQNRHRFFSAKECVLPPKNQGGRFLP